MPSTASTGAHFRRRTLAPNLTIYNKLVTLRNRFKNAFAQIDVQLKRRYDLIPNLVETSKAYMKHESETLEAVIKARNQAASANEKAAADPGNAGAMQGLLGAEALLGGAMGKLLVTVERYPDLKANQNFLDLQHQLEGTENRISVARQRYNKSVQTFNSSIRTFPNNLTNNFLLNLERKEPFKADAGAEKAPQVKF